MKFQIIIPAAGLGRRLGADQPKALVPLAGKPLILHTLERFAPVAGNTRMIVVHPESWHKEFAAATASLHDSIILLPGGLERSDSVEAGLKVLDRDTDIVVIHDAARPFIRLAAVHNAVATAQQEGAATVAIPVSDTILQGDEDAFLERTPDRSRLWACQTPQVFQTHIIKEAYKQAIEIRRAVTDDASLVRLAGFPVKLVEGNAINFKITTPEDIVYAEYLVQRGML
ncbi:MAG: 2-C-methyl-D-erythritol 4-phosphate cytidylyltransferase [Candidatus Hydrogenedentales bacterium]|jgi:2-C-methyl-D-erythritol 4-phosphate cytidylyltransferase